MTQRYLKDLFEYKEGFLYWKISKGKAKKGNIAGVIDHHIHGSRRRITVDGKLYQASRIIFLWHKGFLPKNIDHKDRDKLNDKIENLREATDSQNGANKDKTKIKTSSKYKGVYFEKSRNKWVAVLQKDKKSIKLGRYDSEEDAALAYNKAALLYFGSFAVYNAISI